MATQVATSTSNLPVVRAGARGIVKLNSGNLLIVYWDGTAGGMYKTREASSESGLSTATAVAATLVGTGCANNDGLMASLFADPASAQAILYGWVQNEFTLVDQTYSAGAWGANGGQNGQGNGADAIALLSAVVSSVRYYWLVGGLGHVDVATTFGVPNNGEKDATWGTNPTVSTPPSFVAMPWKGVVLRATIDNSTGVLGYVAANALDGSGATYTFPAITSIETLAVGQATNNLAGVSDSNGNAWLAYNDGAGIKLRMLTATGSAWTAKTTVTSQVSDSCPALFQDTAGNVWVFWIDGASGAIKGQKATVSGSAISLTGTVQTVFTPSATPSYLSVIESDASNAYLVWTQGAASPYGVYVHTYGIGGGGTSVALAGEVAALGSPAGTLSTTDALTGEVPALGSPAATLSVSHLLTAGVSGLGSPVGTLTNTDALSGELAALGSPQGTLTVTTSGLVGEVPGLGSPAGTLTVSHALTSEVAALGSPSGTLTVLHALAAEVAGLGPLAATLTVQHALSGAVAGFGPVAGSLSVVHPLAGEVASLGGLAGTLVVGTSVFYVSPVGVTTAQPGLVGATTAQSGVTATTVTQAGMLVGTTVKE